MNDRMYGLTPTKQQPIRTENNHRHQEDLLC